ncbi:hypothetical protein Sango_3014500 [Sesamum angolense]|uniref:Integrase catalytic domain-containing protein n=1 Tax=Sesamum angolense TaxID=2727404 RepID=A0AAE1T3F9_9LAMI|nr:hypothetical protein Sango_3014500 [Sesamum angolense]
MALDAGAKDLIAYTDSLLVTKQVEGEYEVKEERTKEYLQEIVGMDIVGPFPVATEQCKYHLVVVDYFRKWGWKIQDLCAEQGIQQCFTSVADPQANGKVEVINRILVQRIKTKLTQAGGQWVDALPRVLWSYRTTPHSTTGETPFNLVYGFEVVIPAEAELETFRIHHYEQENNDSLLRANLDLIEKVEKMLVFVQKDVNKE